MTEDEDKEMIEIKPALNLADNCLDIKGNILTMRPSTLKALVQAYRQAHNAKIKAESQCLAFAAQVKEMSKTVQYFSCPECKSSWFRTIGLSTQLECQRCGWQGPREEGESLRFLKPFAAYESLVTAYEELEEAAKLNQILGSTFGAHEKLGGALEAVRKARE